MKTDLIWESVVQENAAERRGTHATKNRALVSGSGKKPWQQKGTGRARVGEIRNPLWRKGGTVFGPQPRSYDYDLPKKVRLGALRAALAQKLNDGAVIVVDRLEASDRKTKTTAELLQAARRDRQDAGHRREARRAASRCRRATSPACSSWPSSAGHGARRHGHDARRRDARGAREAAGDARIAAASAAHEAEPSCSWNWN